MRGAALPRRLRRGAPQAILATGELGTLRNCLQSLLVAMMAGADFVKTSTGKETENATPVVSLVMVRAVRSILSAPAIMSGSNPRAASKTAKDALLWLSLMKEELGRAWLEPELFRFGASSLLGDIERQLEHFVTGRYAALYRQQLA
jgi:deoxyribose-phosphate aldolase